MKKKTFTIVAFAALAIVIGALTVTNQSFKNDSSEESLVAANIEALSDGENVGKEPVYVRNTDVCRMNIGVGGEVKLLGGTILKANSQGEIVIDGVVICSRGGNDLCKPIECKDLYETIFGGGALK